MKDFFIEHSQFSKHVNTLRNIVSGVVASSPVNVDKSEEVGQNIIAPATHSRRMYELESLFCFSSALASSPFTMLVQCQKSTARLRILHPIKILCMLLTVVTCFMI